MSSQPSSYHSANEYPEPEPEPEPELDLNLDALTTQPVLNSFDDNPFNTDLDLDLDPDDYEIDDGSLSEPPDSDDDDIFGESSTARSNLMPLPPEAIYSSKQEQIDSIQAFAKVYNYCFQVGRSKIITATREKVWYKCNCAGAKPIEDCVQNNPCCPQA
jgi:hypothetical protein